MATAVTLPKQGQSVETCIITQWFKNSGDKITEGEALFSYETDKAAFDEEAKASGTLLEIFFNEGDEVPVLTNIAVIGRPGESIEQYRPIADSFHGHAEFRKKHQALLIQALRNIINRMSIKSGYLPAQKPWQYLNRLILNG